jgi:hypothetical protein
MTCRVPTVWPTAQRTLHHKFHARQRFAVLILNELGQWTSVKLGRFARRSDKSNPFVAIAANSVTALLTAKRASELFNPPDLGRRPCQWRLAHVEASCSRRYRMGHPV